VLPQEIAIQDLYVSREQRFPLLTQLSTPLIRLQTEDVLQDTFALKAHLHQSNVLLVTITLTQVKQHALFARKDNTALASGYLHLQALVMKDTSVTKAQRLDTALASATRLLRATAQLVLLPQPHAKMDSSLIQMASASYARLATSAPQAL